MKMDPRPRSQIKLELVKTYKDQHNRGQFREAARIRGIASDLEGKNSDIGHEAAKIFEQEQARRAGQLGPIGTFLAGDNIGPDSVFPPESKQLPSTTPIGQVLPQVAPDMQELVLQLAQDQGQSQDQIQDLTGKMGNDPAN